MRKSPKRPGLSHTSEPDKLSSKQSVDDFINESDLKKDPNETNVYFSAKNAKYSTTEYTSIQNTDVKKGN